MSNIEPVEDNPDSSNQNQVFIYIEDLINKIEDPFLEALSEFGKKANLGFQTIKPWPFKWVPYGFKFIPEVYKFSEPDGEFTGVGLCAVSCAALEKILVQRLGFKVIVQPILIRTTVTDIYPNVPIDSIPYFEHTILRLSTKLASVTYDPTYRQVNFYSAKPTLLIPTYLENRYYTYEALAASIHEKKKIFNPILRKRNNLNDIVISKIKEGKMETAKVDDYMRLLEI